MSTSWIVITAEDLNDYLLGAQMQALRESALADNQADPFANVMHARCNYIRNRLSGRCEISATPYAVPPELKSQACLLIIEAMQGRIPAMALSDDQKTQIARAYKDLDIAGTESFPISTAADSESAPVEDTKGGISVVRKPTSTHTKDSFSGL